MQMGMNTVVKLQEGGGGRGGEVSVWRMTEKAEWGVVGRLRGGGVGGLGRVQKSRLSNTLALISNLPSTASTTGKKTVSSNK